jgi:hypothetical protein
MIDLATTLAGLGAVGRAGVHALFNVSARDPTCQEAIARAMLQSETSVPWGTLGLPERALWLRRAQAAVEGMRDFITRR